MSSLKRKKEAYESIIETLKEIQNDLNSGAILVVEGTKDEKALENIGISGDIRRCANVPLAVFCETLARENKKINILTDWDSSGRILASRMAEYLEYMGAEFDLSFRRKIIRYSKKEISDVESLWTYLTRLKNEISEVISY